MTNNNWIETMKQIGHVCEIHTEITDEFIEITKELITKKDQEHKAELEMIKGEIESKILKYSNIDNYRAGYNFACEDTISILDSHIDKLSTE